MARTFVFPTDDKNGVSQAGIVKYVTLDEDAPKEKGWIEITKDELEINSFPEKFYIEDEKLHKKREVKIKFDKRIINSDGVDTAKIEFEAPDDVGEIEVEVRGVRLGKHKTNIKKGQLIDLTIDVDDVVRIGINDPKLYVNDSDVYLVARKKGSGGVLETKSNKK